MQHSPGGLVVEPSEAVSTLDDLRGGLFRRRCEQPLPLLYGPNIPMHYKNVHSTTKQILLADVYIHRSCRLSCMKSTS